MTFDKHSFASIFIIGSLSINAVTGIALLFVSDEITTLLDFEAIELAALSILSALLAWGVSTKKVFAVRLSALVFAFQMFKIHYLDYSIGLASPLSFQLGTEIRGIEIYMNVLSLLGLYLASTVVRQIHNDTATTPSTHS